ncbi:haloacid dehalogenase type II [Desulfobacterota bacterium AH_259_B03_O07]|nr:haloacid dehalogenase type II [Desulfobacterota bacterium AH_259_B03_O07]
MNRNIKISSIKALAFDVFGTVVDWRTTIIRECTLLGKAKGIHVDWAQFADAWRAGYAPAMDQVRRSELSWMNIDSIHRMILERLLIEFEIKGLTESEKYDLNRIWHRLRPWPDSVRGLRRLRKRYVLATLSNGNMALLVNMAKNAGLPWDCILSSELSKHYKPDKEVYRTAADLLGLGPEQVMMVAAHKDDLNAAKTVGFKTAFVVRPLEFGPAGTPDLSADPSFDIRAKDFIDLATKLEA